MADLFEYISWRGDLLFSAVPFTPVDALLFSCLAYLRLDGLVPETPEAAIPLPEVAELFLALPDAEKRVRVKNDLTLLRAAASAPRYRSTRLTFYRSIFIPEEETQFAAVTFLPEDGSAFLAFRGTDYSLVGWKEDFNMSFQDSIPAQREALSYTISLGASFTGPLRLGGHSKGGNLAVYAGAKSPLGVQNRILAVYSLDGPGFTSSLMGNSGYLRLVPRIRTFIPESSVIGILLEHEEPYAVIRSRQVSILQHEPYSWQIMAGDFLYLQENSTGSQLAQGTVRNWIADMTPQERSEFVDALFELLSAGGAEQVGELLHPKSVVAFFRALKKNPRTQRLLTSEMVQLLRAAGETITELRSRKG